LALHVGVVGAGIVGSCAAFELASAGVRVTLLERFAIDHDRGSSYGDSRIIRRFYDDPYYTRLMETAFPLWTRLESASGKRLYERFGGLYFGPRGHRRLASAEAGMRAVGAEPVLMDAREMRARFPAFVFDDDEAGLFDESAGSLRASACVEAAVGAARVAGAIVRTNVRVERITESDRLTSGGGIELRTDTGEILHFDRALLCAGPWTSGMLAALELPVTPTRQQYVYLRPTRDAGAFAPGSMPVWIDAASDWYGFPEHGAIEGVKFASHVFGERIDPDDVDRRVDASVIANSRAYAKRRLPALADGDVTYSKVCLYTVSSDEDFIVDAVPGIDGCSFVTGCSGHAFKFGTLLGAVAADLARDLAPRVDISRFRLDRFAGTG
jgi:monomeric sarcosine oxidase